MRRVEVADDDVHVEPERCGAIEPPVRRDDGPGSGHLDCGPLARGDDHDIRFDHASSAGITQIRSCGSAAR